MFILNRFSVYTRSQSSSSCCSNALINTGLVLKCAFLFLPLISSSLEQERHNNDSLQILLSKSPSNVQTSYSLISSFTKLLPKTSNKTSAKNTSLPQDSFQRKQLSESIAPSFFILESTAAAPSNISDNMTSANQSTSPGISYPVPPHHSTTISSNHDPPNPSQSNLFIKNNVNSSLKNVHDTSRNFTTSEEQPSTLSPQPNISIELTTLAFPQDVFNFFPEQNSSQDLFILIGYNTSSVNYSYYPDDPGGFNSSNGTLSEEPLANVLLLGGLSVLLGVMILVTVIGKFSNYLFTHFSQQELTLNTRTY